MSVEAIGVEPSGGDNLAGQTTDSSQEPQVIDLPDENALIRVKGSDKPVKYSEIGRNFQAQFTKASQRAAQLEREIAQERELRLKYEQERLRTSQGQQQNQAPDVFAQLRELPYLSGEAAAEVVQTISTQVKERDKVIMALAKKLQDMDGRLGGLYDNHTNQSFESKINKWVTDLGYGPEASEVAKEIYLAYTGDDLDQEFPRIFEERMKQLEGLFEARKRASLERARRQPFIPGRGGQTGPSAPIQLKPNASPREIADLLWEAGNGSGT